MRAILAILLSVPLLVGTICPSAFAAWNAADDAATPGCCDQQRGDAQEQDPTGHTGCDATCSSCCKVPAIATFLPPPASDLVAVDRPAVEPALPIVTRRLDAPLRPPRALS